MTRLLTRLLIALAGACAIGTMPAAAATACGSNHIPADHAAVIATNGQWAALTISTGVLARGRDWRVWDGGPIPGQSPDECMLLTIRTAPPDYDERLQEEVCTETANPEANELRIVCNAPLRSVDQLRGAVKNTAAVLTAKYCAARDIENPADVILMVADTRAENQSQSVDDAGADALDVLDTVDATYLRAIRARKLALYKYITEHPNQAPPLNDGWPESPIPTTPAEPEE